MIIYSIILYFSVIFCFFAEAMDTFVNPQDRTHNVVMKYVKERDLSYVDNLPPQLFKWTTDIPSFVSSRLNVEHSDVWGEYREICSKNKDSKANTLSVAFRGNIVNDPMFFYGINGRDVLNSNAVWAPCAYPVLFGVLEQVEPEYTRSCRRLNPYALYSGNNNYSDTEMQVLLKLCGIQCEAKQSMSVCYENDTYKIDLRNNKISIQKNIFRCPVSYNNKKKETISCDQNHYVNDYYVNGYYVNGYYVNDHYVDGYYVDGYYVNDWGAGDSELGVLCAFQKVLRYCFIGRFFQADASYACICFSSGQYHLYRSYIDKGSSVLFKLLSHCHEEKKKAKSIDLSMYSRLDPCGVCMELLNWFSNVMNDKTKRETFLKTIFSNDRTNYNTDTTDDFSFNIWMVSDMPYQDSMLAGVTFPYIQSMVADKGVTKTVAPRIACYRYKWQKYIAP